MMKKLLSFCLAVALVLGLVGMAPEIHAASNMKASESCIAFIKEFEGFSGKPYRDSDGKYTIGYGTRCPDELVDKYMATPMTKEEADAELREKLVTYETAVNQFIDRNGLDYSQQQFDALVSLVFNCGSSWLSKGSTLVKALVSGAVGNDLIYAFSIYSMSGGTRSLGHVRRRLAEANIYLNGIYSRTVPDNFAYVLYNAQGGQIHASGGSYNVQGYDAAQTAAPIATASREGYIFKGWYTAISGGRKVTALDMTTKNATLYARWEEDNGTSAPTDPMEPTDPIEPTVPTDAPSVAVDVTVTGSVVNLRGGPGLSYEVVGSANKGDKLTVIETKKADGYNWGKTAAGWIALKHTNYAAVTAPTEPTPTGPAPTEPAPTEPTACEHEYELSGQKAPTCDAAGGSTYTCKLCGDSYTESVAATGHEYSAATCTKPEICKICGHKNGEPLGHSYEEPTCIKSQVCKVCGQTSGEALGHDFQSATCTAPATCKVCGVTNGKPLSHKYAPATCTAPQTCTDCGHTTGEALGHQFDEATCTKPQICKTCGCVKGVSLSHDYQAASCTEPKTCKTCGHVDGEALGHDYEPATCTAPKTCKLCGETEGDVVDHEYGDDSICDACGFEKPATQVTKTYATIIKTDALNVRVTPDGAICGSLKLGAKVEILEQKMVGDRMWGRCQKGWICLRSYAKLETVTETVTPPVGEPSVPEQITKTYGTVVRTDTLNVRQEPDGTVVGVLYRGDKLEILEQKMVAGRMWGRTEKGWICLRSYVELEVVTETIGGETPPQTPEVTPDSKPQEPVTVTKTYGTVINTNSLNVRLEPDGEIVTKLYRGDRVEILEQKMANGRLWGLCEQGWICMRSYVALETVTETIGGNPEVPPQEEQPEPEKGPTEGTGDNQEQTPSETIVKTYATVILTDSLNIRQNPDGAVCGSMKLGEKAEILEQQFVSGRLWGRTEQGWICMRTYVKLETVTESVNNNVAAPETGMVTASCLNIRSEASTGSAVVGYLFKGATVVILEKKTVNGNTWARIEQGWISMAYVA